jgi:hypothetical protein
MSTDPVLDNFLSTTVGDAAYVLAQSDCLHLVPRQGRPTPYDTWDGVFVGVGHLVRATDRTVSVSRDPLPFTLRFPADYLRSHDRTLQFRIASLGSPILHPNVRGAGLVCLGEDFRPGTALRFLVEQLFGIVCGRIAATDRAFDAEAAAYYLSHPEQLDTIRRQSFKRRPVAARSRCEQISPLPVGGSGGAS